MNWLMQAYEEIFKNMEYKDEKIEDFISPDSIQDIL